MKLINHQVVASILISSSLFGAAALTTNVFHENELTVSAATNQQRSTSSASKKQNGKDTVPAKPTGSMTNNTSASSAKLTGSKVINDTTTSNQEKISSTKANQSAVYVKNNGNLTLNNATVTKTGNTTSEDNSNFYGQNAGIVVTKNGVTTINNLNETTNANGANAVFATGKNAKINLNHATINTYQDSSRGLDATLTGQITAKDVNITTRGSHSATLANDRGGGTINLNQGTLKTTGDGSPIIYSTGKINVNNVTGNAASAEAAVIEGANSINVSDSTLTGNKNNGVMLYQSMSGDANEGTASFTMNNGSLTSNAKDGSKGTANHNGALFYVTNTKAKINLTDVKLTNASNTLLRIASDRWGTSGKNGGDVNFTANQQSLDGNIEVAKSSSLNLTIKNNSKLTGAINTANSGSTINISLDSTSEWDVTKDSYISGLIGDQSTIKKINSNGHNVYYDKNNSNSSWLDGKTYQLSGGGKLIAKS